MERNREARRGSSMAASNGILRRRHRTSNLRDSPEEDGPVELQETARLRDRGVKKDRDRDRERERDRDRERSSRSKRRRAERLMHGSNREDGGDDSSEESVNDEEEDDEEDGGGGLGVGNGAIRMLPPIPASSVSNHHLQHRKGFLPSTANVFRAAPVWKAGDEMIGVSVPRKARTASTKRSHDWISTVGGVGGEPIYRQASTSPVRQILLSTSTPSPAAPVSPSSSNVSIRKKMKPNGAKPRPPKSSSKPSSSNREELEIEIAEVLYGLMTQSQGPSKKVVVSNDSGKFDSGEVNKPSCDLKSKVSSPISNSPLMVPQSSLLLPQNSSSSATPLSAVAPKRKRPRQLTDNMNGFGVRNSPISSTKVEVEVDQIQPPKTEISSPDLENSGSAAENGRVPYDLVNFQALPSISELATESMKVEQEAKPLVEEGESRDVVLTKEEVTSPKKESPPVRLDNERDDASAIATTTELCSTASEREEKFQIDLMASPPRLRSSPEKEGEINFVEADHKPVVYGVATEVRSTMKDKDDEKAGKVAKDGSMNVEAVENKTNSIMEEAESQKSSENKGRSIDLQLDLEKQDIASGSKLQHQVQKRQQPAPTASREEPHTEKTALSNSLPLPMSMATWPGGLPQMGYMAPLPGVLSMDGSTVSSAPTQPLFSQPRPKRCATHCYIARNIHYLQQFIKINPFWPSAAGSAPLFGAKVLPSADLHGNMAGRSGNSVLEKGQGLPIFPGHAVPDKVSQAAIVSDTAQRKHQIFLQQALPPVTPNNILHGPAFFFPLNQQQATVAAASARPGSGKSPTTAASLTSSSATISATVSGSATAAAATAMSFSYPNMPANETQYLAILQNNAYPFPITTVGAPPNYRGAHAQAMPFFNGSIYSQMIHPSQLQQQPPPPPPPPSQPQQMQQGHQNASISSGSSSSQKHLQSQQQRPQGGSVNGGSGNGNIHNFPAPKNRSAQPPVQQQNQHIPSMQQGRQLENDVGGEDSPSTADSRVSRAMMNIYGQNFAMPIHPQNFALMSPPAAFSGTSTANGSGNPSEKKHQQQPQQQGLKAGVESLAPHTFAMSFAPMNGVTTAPSIDVSSMAQNHNILQSFSEATRQNYQFMTAAAAAQVAQQKKNFRISEDGKSGGDSSNVDEDRKGLVGKAMATAGQSIAFSRDLTDASGSAISGNNVIDNSSRTLNHASGPARTSRSPMHNAVSTVNTHNSHLQAHQQHQQQQMMQLHKQHQQQQHFAAARSKTSTTSNGSAYSDHLASSSSVTAKFPTPLSSYPQNLVQSSSNSSPTRSPQWKNSARTTSSQAPSSLASSSHKNIPQHQARTQQSHSQLSFGANQKPSSAAQVQQPPTSNHSPSPPMLVGSPTSSISKGAGGSPRATNTASTSIKTGQASTLSSQQAKNSPSGPSQKSSPVNVRSILGNPHTTSNLGTGNKPQIQQQQQQQLPKNMHQTQLFYSNPYMQAQSPHSTSTSSSTASATSGYYLHRRRPEQQQQQPPGSSASSSTGMMSLCSPVTLVSASTSDPAKAVAAAAAAAASNNMKGGGLSSQGGILHAAQFAPQSSGKPHQFMHGGFSYVHTVPAAVQLKQSDEQKQPAGNDNLHACWQPEKK